MIEAIKIHYVKINELKYAQYNPRVISDDDMKSLKRSLKEFGFVDPVIVNKKSGNIVGGHQRVDAAKELDFAEVPAVYVNLSLSREKALNLALNKISGEWDMPKLKDVLEEIDSGEFDLEITGFGEMEIADMMEQVHQEEKEPKLCPHCGGEI